MVNIIQEVSKRNYDGPIFAAYELLCDKIARQAEHDVTDNTRRGSRGSILSGGSIFSEIIFSFRSLTRDAHFDNTSDFTYIFRQSERGTRTGSAHDIRTSFGAAKSIDERRICEFSFKLLRVFRAGLLEEAKENKH